MSDAGKGSIVHRFDRWNNRAFIAGAGIMAAACLFTGCGDKKPAPGALVLARVGDREITEADFKWEVERRQNASQPCDSKEAVLSDLMRHEALLQRARTTGIEKDPQVKREISNLLIGRLIDRDLRQRVDGVTVSAEEIKAAYESRKSLYTRPAQVRLAVLRLEVDPKATEARKAEVRQRMEDARRQVLADPPRGRGVSHTGFGRLAVDYSDDQASRYRGGDIGWIEAGRLPPRWPRDVLETGMALPVGQISGIIESTGGVYMVTKTDSREAVVAPIESVEPVIRQHLISQKRQALESSYRDESLRLVPSSLVTNALSALVMPARGGAEGPQQGLPPSPGNPEKEVQP